MNFDFRMPESHGDCPKIGVNSEKLMSSIREQFSFWSEPGGKFTFRDPYRGLDLERDRRKSSAKYSNCAKEISHGFTYCPLVKWNKNSQKIILTNGRHRTAALIAAGHQVIDVVLDEPDMNDEERLDAVRYVQKAIGKDNPPHKATWGNFRGIFRRILRI